MCAIRGYLQKLPLILQTKVQALFPPTLRRNAFIVVLLVYLGLFFFHPSARFFLFAGILAQFGWQAWRWQGFKIEYWDNVVVLEMDWAANDCKKNFENIKTLMENFSGYNEAHPISTPDKDRFFTQYDTLISKYADSTLPYHKPPPPHQRALTSLRNSNAHCNFYNSDRAPNDGRYQELKMYVSSLPTKPAKNRWILWNIHKNNLVWIVGMSDSNFRQMVKEFQEICEENIRKKKELVLPDIGSIFDLLIFILFIGICFAL